MIAVFGLEPDATPRPEKETDPGRTDSEDYLRGLLDAYDGVYGLSAD